jgi:hypothetical protein
LLAAVGGAVAVPVGPGLLGERLAG